MDATHGKSVADCELIDWEEGSFNCGGDVRDDVFYVDLLVCISSATITQVRTMLEAALEYRSGKQAFASRGKSKPIEAVIRECAHAIKGSAANCRLWRLARAAEFCELPCKDLLQNEAATEEERKALLDRYCNPPHKEISEVVDCFKEFVLFMERDMPRKLEPGIDLATMLDPKTLQDLHRVCTVAYIDSEIGDLWDAFNGVTDAGPSQGTSEDTAEQAPSRPATTPADDTIAPVSGSDPQPPPPTLVDENLVQAVAPDHVQPTQVPPTAATIHPSEGPPGKKYLPSTGFCLIM